MVTKPRSHQKAASVRPVACIDPVLMAVIYNVCRNNVIGQKRTADGVHSNTSITAGSGKQSFIVVEGTRRQWGSVAFKDNQWL